MAFVSGLALVLSAPVLAETTCRPSGLLASADAIVERIERQGIRYVFVGERHDAIAPKRVAVELANRLLDRGLDAGLYVEGFRTDCDPMSPDCRSLARLFGFTAYSELLTEARVPVWPIDGVRSGARVAAMAARIAAGPESVRVVLAGNSHVLFAGNPQAEHRVFGGALRYPNPGDLAEAFPAELTLTLALVESHDASEWGWRRDGCRADYVRVDAAPVEADRRPAR